MVSLVARGWSNGGRSSWVSPEKRDNSEEEEEFDPWGLFARETKKIKPNGVLQELEPLVRSENNKEKAKWVGGAPEKSLPTKI
uniref:Putative ovule protein n=1 Tax=Solanum chacoense TaxID=4108 RepID=A0A0V0H492_SOLCH